MSELGHLRRFAHPRQLMAYLGLLPSEHSSSDRVRKGSITKCGNAHVRWILTEAAQHYFHPPRVSQAMSQRQEGQPRRIKEIAWPAQTRLYRRGRALLARGKSKQKTVTAVTRELAGFLWALCREAQTPGSMPPRLARPGAPVPQAPTPAEPGEAAPADGQRPAPRVYSLRPLGKERAAHARTVKDKAVVGSGGTKTSH